MEDSGESADPLAFTVTVTDDDYYELQDISPARIPDLPRLWAADERSAQDLSAYISHVTRFKLV